MKILNIIGAGRLGQTLAHLWHAHAVFNIGAVCTRSVASAQAAVAFIQAGSPHVFNSLNNLNDLNHLNDLPPADVWLLACPDDQLQACCEALAASGALQNEPVVLHCSGALTSAAVLSSAMDRGAQVASVHPIKSFARPEWAVQDFAGTFCGVEGDAAALAVLWPAFAAIGAQCFTIKPEAKTLYHAASVIACNYLVALQELSIQTFAQAGVAREQAMAILQPIVSGTVANVFQMGTRAALTGPIARGDVAVVAKQLQAVREWRADYAALYQGLGTVTLDLARQNEGFDADAAQELAQVLRADPS